MSLGSWEEVTLASSSDWDFCNTTDEQSLDGYSDFGSYYSYFLSNVSKTYPEDEMESESQEISNCKRFGKYRSVGGHSAIKNHEKSDYQIERLFNSNRIQYVSEFCIQNRNRISFQPSHVSLNGTSLSKCFHIIDDLYSQSICVKKPSQSNATRTEYEIQLEAIGDIQNSETVFHQANTKVYRAVRAGVKPNHWVKTKLFGEYKTDIPPAALQHDSSTAELPACYYTPNGARKKLQGSISCRSPHSKDHFSAVDPSQFLEIDLGSICDVASLTVRARAVDTIMAFPNHFWRKSIFESTDVNPSRWKGATPTVFANEDKYSNEYLGYERFSVHCRVSRGGKWINLGSFKSSRSNFEEDVMLLNQDKILRCQFIRVVLDPLTDFSRLNGIKVSVFGKPLGPSRTTKLVPYESTVVYRVKMPQNKLQIKGRSFRGCSCCRSTSKNSKSKKRNEQTHDIKEALEGLHI